MNKRRTRTKPYPTEWKKRHQKNAAHTNTVRVRKTIHAANDLN